MAGHMLMSKNFNPNLSMQNDLVRKSAGLLGSQFSSVWKRNSFKNQLGPYARSAPNTGLKTCTPVVNKSFNDMPHNTDGYKTCTPVVNKSFNDIPHNTDGYKTCTPVVNKSFNDMSHNTYSDEYDCSKTISDHYDVLSSLSINKGTPISEPISHYEPEINNEPQATLPNQPSYCTGPSITPTSSDNYAECEPTKQRRMNKEEQNLFIFTMSQYHHFLETPPRTMKAKIVRELTKNIPQITKESVWAMIRKSLLMKIKNEQEQNAHPLDNQPKGDIELDLMDCDKLKTMWKNMRCIARKKVRQLTQKTQPNSSDPKSQLEYIAFLLKQKQVSHTHGLIVELIPEIFYDLVGPVWNMNGFTPLPSKPHVTASANIYSLARQVALPSGICNIIKSRGAVPQKSPPNHQSISDNAPNQNLDLDQRANKFSNLPTPQQNQNVPPKVDRHAPNLSANKFSIAPSITHKSSQNLQQPVNDFKQQSVNISKPALPRTNVPARQIGFGRNMTNVSQIADELSIAEMKRARDYMSEMGAFSSKQSKRR